MAAAGWNGGSVLWQGMTELLACDAHHGRPTWAQRRLGDRGPVRLLRRRHVLGPFASVLMYESGLAFASSLGSVRIV